MTTIFSRWDLKQGRVSIWSSVLLTVLLLVTGLTMVILNRSNDEYEDYSHAPRSWKVGDHFGWAVILDGGGEKTVLETVAVEENGGFEVLRVHVLNDERVSKSQSFKYGAQLEMEGREILSFPLSQVSWNFTRDDEEWQVDQKFLGIKTVPAGDFEVWQSMLSSANKQQMFWYSPELGFFVYHDHDTNKDGMEWSLFLWGHGDQDSDRIGDSLEHKMGWNPLDPDTDHDGVLDSIDLRPLSDLTLYVHFGEFWVQNNPDLITNGNSDTYIVLNFGESYQSTIILDRQTGDFNQWIPVVYDDRIHNIDNFTIEMWDDDTDEPGEGSDRDNIDLEEPKGVLDRGRWQIVITNNDGDGGYLYELDEEFELKGTSDGDHAGPDGSIKLIFSFSEGGN